MVLVLNRAIDTDSGTKMGHLYRFWYEPDDWYRPWYQTSPESLKPRMDLFYMKPESSSSPDSPLWYTTTSLDRNTLESLLNRILLIRDIYDERDTSLDEED
ncbi:Zinc finger MYM-type protein 2 [Acipenser ruthenus]|uniref:Zinc finger MYM-type protein 2 n=1 Tax=Acipenser ruthenus TaxID=7906 RepID=A0A444UW03_ACIRT|nr:Zinc finger MYM-type protein 2 [Acipenser ruthenus]